MGVANSVPFLVQMLVNPSMYARRVMAEVCVKDVIFLLSAEESFAGHVPQLPRAMPEPVKLAWQLLWTSGPGQTKFLDILAGTSKIH